LLVKTVNKMEIEKGLHAFGLNEKETQVYLQLVKLGESFVAEISQRANIERSTTYYVLSSLKAKGLISPVLKNKKTYYIALQPTSLLSILKDREEKVKKIIPLLESVAHSTDKRPEATVFEGKAGLLALLEDILVEKKPISVIASIPSMFEVFEHNFPLYTEKRSKLKIAARILTDEKPPVKKFTKCRHLKVRSKTSTVVYGDKVAFFSLVRDEPSGVLITDREIAIAQNSLFEELWKNAREF